MDLVFGQVRCPTSRKLVAAVDLRRQQEVSFACFIQCFLNIGRNKSEEQGFLSKSVAVFTPLGNDLKKNNKKNEYIFSMRSRQFGSGHLSIISSFFLSCILCYWIVVILPFFLTRFNHTVFPSSATPSYQGVKTEIQSLVFHFVVTFGFILLILDSLFIANQAALCVPFTLLIFFANIINF